MQNPEVDTEWNDILRAHGILPPKESQEDKNAIEDELNQFVADTVKRLQGHKDISEKSLQELVDCQDDDQYLEDDRVLKAYK